MVIDMHTDAGRPDRIDPTDWYLIAPVRR